MSTESISLEPEESFIVSHNEDDEDVDFVETAAGILFSVDPVKDYLRLIGRTPLLKAEEEIELAKRIETGVYAAGILLAIEGEENVAKKDDTQFIQDLASLAADGKAAKEHMTEANLRLVVSIAKRYTGRGMPFLDVIQEGNLGLNHAVEMFDYTKGYKFSTYATWWIRQAITRSLADKSKIIRVPVHMHEKLIKLERVKKEMHQNLGREVTPAELALEMEMPERTVLDIIKYSRQEPISLNMPIGETGGRGQTDSEFGDTIADEGAPTPYQELEKVLLKGAFEKIFDTFSEREAGVIRMRFGFDDGQPKTLDYIGKEYGVTRERIRQIEHKAMAKLRSRWSQAQLRVFLDNS